MKKVVLSLPAIGLSLSLAHSARAEEAAAHFEVPVSLSLGLGRMQNKDVGMISRVVSNLSLGALPGVRFGNTHLGLDLNYEVLDQITGIKKANYVNSRGTFWSAGVGIRQYFTESFALQLGIDFAGEYRFSKKQANVTSYLRKPLVIILKPQYLLSDVLSLDLDLRYAQWEEIKAGSVTIDKKTNLWSAGVGVTYLLGGGAAEAPKPVAAAPAPKAPEPAPAPVPEPAPTPAPVPAPEPKKVEQEKTKAELAKLLDLTDSDEKWLLNLDASGFKTASATLAPQTAVKLKKVGQILSQYPENKVQIEGHTDSSGKVEANKKLSLARANAVKAALVAGGAKAENIETVGLGSSKPIEDNATAAGRAKNRRVEISILK